MRPTALLLSFLLLLLAPSAAQTPAAKKTGAHASAAPTPAKGATSKPTLVATPGGVLTFELGKLRVPAEASWVRVEAGNDTVYVGTEASHPDVKLTITHHRQVLAPSPDENFPQSFAENYANATAETHQSRAVDLHVQATDDSATFSFQLSSGTMVSGYARLGPTDSLIITSIGGPPTEMQAIVASFEPAGSFKSIGLGLDRESLVNAYLLTFSVVNALFVLLSVALASVVARKRPGTSRLKAARNVLAALLAFELLAAVVVWLPEPDHSLALLAYFCAGMLLVSGTPLAVLAWLAIPVEEVRPERAGRGPDAH